MLFRINGLIDWLKKIAQHPIFTSNPAFDVKSKPFKWLLSRCTTLCRHKVSVLARCRDQTWHHKWFMEIFWFFSLLSQGTVPVDPVGGACSLPTKPWSLLVCWGRVCPHAVGTLVQKLYVAVTTLPSVCVCVCVRPLVSPHPAVSKASWMFLTQLTSNLHDSSFFTPPVRHPPHPPSSSSSSSPRCLVWALSSGCTFHFSIVLSTHCCCVQSS